MWRGRTSFVIATGLHLALIILAGKNRAAAPEGAEITAPPSEEAVWDLDITPSEVTPPPAEVVPAQPRESPATAPRSEQASALPGSKLGNEGETPNVEPVAPPAPSGSASGGWSFSPTGRGPIDLGLGSARTPKAMARDAVPRVDVPADERPSTTGGLIEALDEEDSKRGMGRGTPVKVAVETAARSTAAPGAGKAVFDISVSIEGAVQINLVSASSNFDEWNQLSAAIRSHLAKKRVRIPPGSKGLHVIVEVEAHEQLPDGHAPGSIGGSLGANRNAPGLAGALPSVENIGVRPTRIVSSRITRETRL